MTDKDESYYYETGYSFLKRIVKVREWHTKRKGYFGMVKLKVKKDKWLEGAKKGCNYLMGCEIEWI